ncbi:hypothetical protein GDO78_010609 [Eleutherodactylus coqui]|uniref:ATPase AAA-type core domain-containing protein n=1 Tax=Eleutherodactylus coqui TaxID=57060 RepID=A0A8J6K5D9_ELECQ|nr:hypothetical protein GDO78_010609 [Eleutherodactylus coqui]
MALPGIPYEQRLLIMADPREKALQDYRKKLLEHKEIDGRLKELREQLKELTKQYEKSENDLKALQSVGQVIYDVIVKATNGPRYVVGCRRQVSTGKTLLARAVASQLDCNFLKVVSSSIVDKYIGESARLIREMFNYARDHQPCIIFMDEIDAIGMFAIRADHDFVVQEDFMKAVRKVADSKKLESKLDYKPV